jgi:hypothetical protein
MATPQKSLRNGIVSIIILAVTGVLLLFIWHSPESTPLPSGIGSLRLETVVSGTDAKQTIDHLHNKSISPEVSYIGRYAGGNGSAVLYASLYSADDQAFQVVSMMAEGINGGSDIFGHYRAFDLHGKRMQMCLGMGQVHYFFSHGRLVYWLSVDAPIAQETIQFLVDRIVE